MTRKDFQLIAASLKATREALNASTSSLNLVVEGFCDEHAHNMADALELANASFKRHVFLTACGVTTIRLFR